MLFLGLVQSLISALVFWFREPRHPSHRILAGWLLIFALLFSGLLLPGGLVAFIRIGFVPFFMLSGPILYLYVRSLVVADFQLQLRDGWHALPFVLMAVFRLFYLPESISTETFHQLRLQSGVWMILGLIVLSIVLYWITTVLLLYRHQRNVLQFFSNRSDRRSLKWVPLFMLATLFSHVFFFSGAFLGDVFVDEEMMSFWCQQFNMALLGYLLLVFGLNQSIIFKQPAGRVPILLTEEYEVEKYLHSGLTREMMAKLSEKILSYLEADKPFTNPEYNLQTMMQDLDLSQQHLSQTINEHLGKNFYQLVNEYRVREFQRLLRQPESAQFTILSLAYAAGFNSKSSFNRVFKEMMGMTPSQYQKKIGQEEHTPDG